MAKSYHRNDSYESSHGCSPRGYGVWAFTVTVEVDGRFTDLADEDHPHFESGNFGVAKRATQQWARRTVSAEIGGKLLSVVTETLG